MQKRRNNNIVMENLTQHDLMETSGGGVKDMLCSVREFLGELFIKEDSTEKQS